MREDERSGDCGGAAGVGLSRAGWAGDAHRGVFRCALLCRVSRRCSALQCSPLQWRGERRTKNNKNKREKFVCSQPARSLSHSIACCAHLCTTALQQQIDTRTCSLLPPPPSLRADAYTLPASLDSTPSAAAASVSPDLPLRCSPVASHSRQSTHSLQSVRAWSWTSSSSAAAACAARVRVCSACNRIVGLSACSSVLLSSFPSVVPP